jgi:hypothetical protein
LLTDELLVGTFALILKLYIFDHLKHSEVISKSAILQLLVELKEGESPKGSRLPFYRRIIKFSQKFNEYIASTVHIPIKHTITGWTFEYF